MTTLSTPWSLKFESRAKIKQIIIDENFKIELDGLRENDSGRCGGGKIEEEIQERN